MPVGGVRHVPPAGESGKDPRGKAFQTRYLLQRNRRPLRNVVPTKDEMTAIAQPGVRMLECRLALRRSIQSKAVDPIGDDEIEIALAEVLVEPFPGSNDMSPPAAEFPRSFARFNRPEVTPFEEDLLVMAGIPVTTDKQNGMKVGATRVKRTYYLLENSPVFGPLRRGQAKRVANGTDRKFPVREQPPDDIPGCPRGLTYRAPQ